MTIQYPRPIDTGARIYGLGMRQIVYLAVGVFAGGLTAFGVFTPGLSLVARLLIGAVFASIGFSLAFMKVKGLYLDTVIIHGAKHLFSPRRSVWRKEGEEIELTDEGLEFEEPEPALNFVEDAPVVSMGLRSEESVAVSTVAIIILNVMVLSILAGAAVYMYNGGLEELSGWLSRGGMR